MQYVELNPIRAGIVKSNKPEDYVYSSLHYRTIGKANWLADLCPLMGIKSKRKVLKEYKMIVYYRGGVQSKDNQAVIPDSIISEAEEKNFATEGLFMKKLRFFNDGLVIGSQAIVKDWLEKLKEQGKYQRRKNAVVVMDGYAYSLRDQRSHFEKDLE